jgi:ribonuclease-3
MARGNQMESLSQPGPLTGPPDLDRLVAEVAERTGYRFRDPALLTRSLTHRSLAGSPVDYEALEFLGDRVLDMVIAEDLYRDAPAASAGELARALNRLVRAETLTDVARELRLAEYLRTDARNPAAANPSARVLSEACEALIAAVYLDGGFDAARSFIRRHWRERIRKSWLTGKDAKSTLQEWLAGRSLGCPVYRETSRAGPDHLPHFEVEVSVAGLRPARGSGSSKRQAEQRAAEAMLRHEGVWRGG